MQAIHRAFKEYLTISIEKDNLVNNIILAQACRHVIVHSGGVASERLIRQIKGAFPRDVKSEIKRDNKVQFSPDEVEIVSKSMGKYVKSLAEKTYTASKF
jgi:hypothetical protein